jgi:hypothetical protein
MAEISGFHGSENGDRRYKADFWARFLGSLIGNGVYPNPSTNLQVIANGDMTVTVKAGKAWVNGVFYENTSDKVITLDVADGVLKRIDRIVVSDITLERDTYIKVKKGSFASTPTAPSLQRDADAHELGIADIYIVNGAVSISQANITDLRLNSEYCGIVHGIIDQVDTTTLFNQYQAWFEETKQKGEADFYAFLADLEGTLSGDVAGNLLVKINDNAADISVHTTAIANIQLDYAKHPGYGTTTGSANAYILSLNPAPSSLVDGFGVCIKINVQNTGASTLNVNGLGAKSILDSKGNAMTTGKLKANTPYTMRYNGINFILQGEGASGNATASDLYSGKTASVDAGEIIGTNPYKAGATVDYSKFNISAYAGRFTSDTTKGLVGVGIDTSGNGWFVQFVSSTLLTIKKIVESVGVILTFNVTLPNAVNGYSTNTDVIVDNNNNLYVSLSNSIVKINLNTKSLVWQTPLLTNWSIQAFAADSTFDNFYIGNQHGSGTELFKKYNSGGGLVYSYSDSINYCKEKSLVVDTSGNIHMLTYIKSIYPSEIDYRAFTPAMGVLCVKTKSELGLNYKSLFVSSKDPGYVYFLKDYYLQKFDYNSLSFLSSIGINNFVYLLGCGYDGNFICCGTGSGISGYYFSLMIFDKTGKMLCMTNPNESYSYPGTTFRYAASRNNIAFSAASDYNTSYPALKTAVGTRILPEFTLV